MSYFNPTTLLSMTVDDGETVSESVFLDGLRAFGFVVPGTVAGSNVTFEGSNDNSTWYELYSKANAELSYAVTAGKFIGFGDDLPYFAAWNYIRATSDSAASGADEEWLLVARDL